MIVQPNKSHPSERQQKQTQKQRERERERERESTMEKGTHITPHPLCRS
eukprot:COSAG05_NODE_8414_length_706_cov_0.818781_1_plen_48_part_10